VSSRVGPAGCGSLNGACNQDGWASTPLHHRNNAAMPPVRSIRIDTDALRLEDGSQGARVFPWSNLPTNPHTIYAAETAVTNWLRQSADGHYQVAVHVFSLDPLRLTVLTANVGETIPANWWAD